MKRPSQYIALALLLLTGHVFAKNVGPDAKGYTATDSTAYSFFDITSTGSGVLAGTDDDAIEIALGFKFRFYDVEYTKACVSTNGTISFGGCLSEFANLDLTSTNPPGNVPLIAPFWTDLTFDVAGAGAVYYQTEGTEPSRRFIVQWNNAFPVNANKGVTFQVILSETKNSILFQYKDVDLGASPASLGGQSTVGIRNTDALSLNHHLQWSFNAPVLQNDQAILYNGDSTPPTITPLITGNVGKNSWYVGDVALHWDLSDAESGIGSSEGCNDRKLESDTAGTTIECKATNTAGMPAAKQVAIKLDKTRPAITGLPTACNLWPPNNRMVQVAVIAASDATSQLASFQVTATSNQADRSTREPDTIVTRNGNSFTVQVRARTQGRPGSHVYSIVAVAEDQAGHQVTANASCVVQQ